MNGSKEEETTTECRGCLCGSKETQGNGANEMEAEASGTVFSHSQSELVEASTSLLATSAATEIPNIVTETSVPDSVPVPATVTSSLASEQLQI